MKSEFERQHWQQIEALFAEAITLSGVERAVFLENACETQPHLRAHVEALCEAHEKAASYLDVIDGSNAAVLLQETHQGSIAEAGTRVGSYQLIREIGRGGMGVVYLAERADGQFEQQVALKLMKQGIDTAQVRERFLRERQILAQLRHPNISRLLDGGVDEAGRPYIVMEYVAGTSLIKYCNEHTLDIDARLQLFQHVCKAVQYAHQNLTVHRDLKPSNMLVTSADELKLLDFGIAKLLTPDTTPGQTLTQMGSTPMTPEYAAPEQFSGEPVTTATDVYALGVVLYELLVGRRPFVADNASPKHISEAIAASAPSRPSVAVQDKTGTDPVTVSQQRSTHPDRLQRRLAGDLDTIVLKALRKEPDRRYASAEAFFEDIRRHLEGLPVLARSDTFGYRAGKFVRRHRSAVALASLLVMSLFAGLFTTLWQAREAASEAAKADRVKEFTISLFEASNPMLQAQGDSIQVRELLDQGVGRINEELQDQPEVKGEMLATLGRVYRELGSFEKADSLLFQALKVREEVNGPDHPDIATSLYNLAWLKRLTEEFDEADSLYRRSYDMRVRLFGPKHLDVAESALGLGILHNDRAAYDTAISYYNEALAIYDEEYDDPNHSDVLTLQNNLATMYSATDNVQLAESLYTEVLESRRVTLGEQHPHFALSLANLGAQKLDQAEYEIADSLFGEALEVYIHNYGFNHAESASVMVRKAVAKQSLGAYLEADSLFATALEIQKVIFGEVDSRVGSTMYNMARLRMVYGDYAGAERMYRSVMEIDRKTLGEEHVYIALNLDYLGQALLEQGKTELALAYSDRATAMLMKLVGNEHRSTAASFSWKARILLARNQPDEALAFSNKALNAYEIGLDTGHPRWGAAWAVHASIQDALGDAPAADSLYLLALELQREKLASTNSTLARTLTGIGTLRVTQRQCAEALKLLDEATSIYRYLSTSHPKLAGVQQLRTQCAGV
ncbi:MAG: serine/threonine-protein kinase [Bacteroidota bacterium]